MDNYWKWIKTKCNLSTSAKLLSSSIAPWSGQNSNKIGVCIEKRLVKCEAVAVYWKSLLSVNHFFKLRKNLYHKVYRFHALLPARPDHWDSPQWSWGSPGCHPPTPPGTWCLFPPCSKSSAQFPSSRSWTNTFLKFFFQQTFWDPLPGPCKRYFLDFEKKAKLLLRCGPSWLIFAFPLLATTIYCCGYNHCCHDNRWNDYEIGPKEWTSP